VNRAHAACVIVLALSVAFGATAASGAERYPPPEFETGYEIPYMPQPSPRSGALAGMDVAVLAGALSLAAWFGLRLRSRTALVVLAVFSLAYFGFYRRGCICPVGAIQHVALSLADRSYALPFSVALFFVLPLVFALLFGRVFCAGVCPLGVIQDLVIVRPVRLAEWLVKALSLVPFVYLGLAVLFAVLKAGFIICRYDPFVPIFRLSGPAYMLVIGGVFLVVGMFVGRPYCRFLCPYGVLLGICARWSWRKVSITPDECIKCGLCESACPFGAIHRPTPEGVEEE